MKKIILAFAAIATLASCAKEEINESTTSQRGDQITLSFVAEPNSDQTRAFFDSSATTEAWEKSLNTLSVLCFDNTGALILQRDFTPAEVTAKKATFAMPRSSAGATCEFYAVANKAVGDIANKTALLALLDTAPASYNGTFTKVSAQAPTSDGYVMSGMVSKAIAAAGASTDVAITLKRTVAKVAVQTTLAPDFSSRYKGAIRITSAKISKAASQTPVVAPATPAPGAMTFTSTQPTVAASGKFNNLFYLFENGTLATGSRVTLMLEGLYDPDGNFSTTADQIPVSYEVELTGSANNGQIVRNGYYRVAVTLAGLTGQDVAATITVAEWETPVTQTINLGK